MSYHQHHWKNLKSYRERRSFFRFLDLTKIRTPEGRTVEEGHYCYCHCYFHDPYVVHNVLNSCHTRPHPTLRRTRRRRGAFCKCSNIWTCASPCAHCPPFPSSNSPFSRVVASSGRVALRMTLLVLSESQFSKPWLTSSALHSVPPSSINSINLIRYCLG